MTAPLRLVMPMAGRGSRFATAGHACPKPLVPLHGRPFFVWAVESLAARVPIGEMVFVVLREHVEGHAIDREIARAYPQAACVVIDAVTAGAAETAAIGVQALRSRAGAIAINDCDHAFDATGLAALLPLLPLPHDALLLGFGATSPAYSYVRFDAAGGVAGTVEKQVASPYAIAGCYIFASAAAFEAALAQYRETCPYDELFVSGIYNALVAAGGSVGFHALHEHVAFGTPQEMARVDPVRLAAVVAAER